MYLLEQLSVRNQQNQVRIKLNIVVVKLTMDFFSKMLLFVLIGGLLDKKGFE